MLTIFFEIAFMIMFSATIAGGFIVKKYNKYVPVVFVAVACTVLCAISYILDLPIERETSYMISVALMLLLSVVIVAVSFILFKKRSI